MTTGPRDLVMGITPFCEPIPGLVVAVERAGYLGILDLGADPDAASDALDRVRRRLRGRPFGVRLSGGFSPGPGSGSGPEPARPELALPDEVDTVVADLTLHPEVPAALTAIKDGKDSKDGKDNGAPENSSTAIKNSTTAPKHSGVRLIAEVTSPEEAADALRLGADGLLARGCESGGRIGELSTFVLLQRLVAAHPDVPVWAAGGIGPRTAAAAVAGGASGVAVDTQLALTREADLPHDVTAALAAMDGSETTVSDDRRVYTHPGHPGVNERRLPVGQDGAFAAPLAAAYKTAGGVVTAIAESVSERIALAASVEPLKDAVPVQGPMTRVSDKAEFAAAVAADGGLPFLALALMAGDQVATLLSETKTQLGDRSWGVGILGFAPPELREAQLAAISDVRPPFAVIAGGRPSQAKALEDQGIETFLHVPSPGLLETFVKDGAKKFVFEGSECGGHIGPRASFALWESQLAILERQANLAGFEVWFAGGVHDERSAAMIAAMAAPITDRGAKVSVVMGTAYLFTDEIVATGAVIPLYQREAVAMTKTAMLESSPGHVIRVADTPYVAAFAEAKQKLKDENKSQQEAWAELEQLSLGRLRIAAKGLIRDGDALNQVDEATAQADGMFMLGQVAAMHDETTTINRLHESVTGGVTAFLKDRATALGITGTSEKDDEANPLDIAIVGMACFYPGAENADEFWANVVAGTNEITDVPASRWDKGLYPHIPAAKGGFLPEIAFDALKYGIPPSALASIEPVQLLSLEIAARALKDAGYDERPFNRERASVIFGTEPGSDLSAAYGLRAVLPAYTPDGQIPAELDEHLPKLTEDSFPGILGNVISGRIANRLDLGGVNYTVDAACGSSLAALDVACKELAGGTSDFVLCGGADLHNGIHDYEMFAATHALSKEGRCATFDQSADGIALGEGIACVALKRLEDAERDGDRVYAVVKGVAGSSDGRSLGLTAPRPEGQRRALDRAYARAGVDPRDIGLIEAHGTGTVAGDKAELATLTTMFTERGAEPGSAVIGSVKSQIGHTKCAAGLAGLIKIAMALHTGVRPGTLHVKEPTAYWDAEKSPFTFAAPGGSPWPVPVERRYAGVSAFGFGGTNFHAVLAGYDGADDPRHGLREWPAELIVLRGDKNGAAKQLTDLIAKNDAAGRPWTLAQIAATLAARSGPVTAAFVADDLDDLAAKAAGPVKTPENAEPGKVAFLFPGQGSQRPGMTADLFTAFPRLQRLLNTGDAKYAQAMFPPAAFTKEERDRQSATITDTRMAQPTLGIADSAVFDLLAGVGVAPDMGAGHSYGEFAALRAAGVYDTKTLIELSALRAKAILDAAGDDPGAMAAVSAPASQLEPLLAELGNGVIIANYNHPKQSVISGGTDAVTAAVEHLKAQGLGAKRINVACAFHSPIVAGAAGPMTKALAKTDVTAPKFPVYANSTATPYPSTKKGVREVLGNQVAEPVRWTEQVEAMYAAGARVFVEAGPGRVLSGLVKKILGDRPHTVIATDAAGENGLRRFLTALAELVAAGVAIDPEPLFAGRAEPVSGTPKRVQWTIDGHLVRTADGQPVAGGLRPAADAPKVSLGGAPVAIADGTRDAVVSDFLRTTRELVAAQREVVLGYLGAAPSAPVQLAEVHNQIAAERISVPAPAPAAPSAPAPTVTIAEAVVSVISARTGYPADMLGEDLDLEADLSVDSIKRTEIIAALAEQLGLATDGADAESVVEELAKIKTISGLTAWLTEHVGSSGAAAAPAAGSGAGASLGRAEIGDAVVSVISARTGYPADMLGTDLDLEADLSVDSIKRTEIIAALAEQLGLATDGADAESVVEELAKIKTIAGLTDWLTEHVGNAAGAADAPAASAGAGSGASLSREQIGDAVVSVISARTGYPADMLGTDLDLEADLSVDSIKRTEIIAALAEQLGLATDGADAESVVEELAKIKTIAGLTDWLTEHTGGESTGAAQEQRSVRNNSGLNVAPPRRFVVEVTDLEPAAGDAPHTRGAYVIVDDGHGIGLELADLLEARGAKAAVSQAPSKDELAAADALIHLGALRPGAGPVLPAGFEAVRDALLGGARVVLAATGFAGTFGRASAEGDRAGLGLAGLMRTVSAEYPDVLARAVDVDPKESPRTIAARLLAELTDPSGPPVTGYAGERRTALTVREADPLPPAVPALDSSGVVVLTGGARGITANVALTLARETGCHIELLARSAAPSGEPDADVAGITDPAALRGVLIKRGLKNPREIETEIGRIVKDNEMRATLAALESAAASVRYHAVDVRDAAAVKAVLDDVHARHGRIDGVIHGAGVLEDKLIDAKTPESFARVYGTKVDGARGLLDGLPDGVRFAALFGSVSGVFGNRGQADYSAANDSLDVLAHHCKDKVTGRLVSVDWGPWSGGGMVSPELAREYARRGVTLIDSEAGVSALLSELAAADGPPQVVYMCDEAF